MLLFILLLLFAPLHHSFAGRQSRRRAKEAKALHHGVMQSEAQVACK
jgi:hypothetical protein